MRNLNLSHWWFFHAVIILMLIIISHITTELNYRMAVPSGSDFYRYAKFPEVYHGQGISKAAFSGGERPVAGQGRDTTYSVIFSWEHRYILCHRAAARRRPESRSGTCFFRICWEEKRDYCRISTKNSELLWWEDYCLWSKINHVTPLKIATMRKASFSPSAAACREGE